MQKLTVTAKGLYTFPNQISQVPRGALSQANNIVIDREGVIEPRRGFNTLPGTLGSTSTDRANQIFRFGDNVISHYGIINAPTTLAFYSPKTVITGVQNNGSNVITDLNSTTGLYVGQFVTVETVEQLFTGHLTIGSNQLTSIPTTVGLYAGQLIGGLGIPVGTTISSITGSGPYTITMSANSTFTKVNAGIVASNSNILGISANTKITVVGTTSITLSSNATVTSRSIAFNPSDVDVTGDLINSLINGLVNGQTVEFSSTGTLPAGLTAGVIYYIINVSDALFQVSLSLDGPAVNITTQGTGVHTLTTRNSIDCYGWINYTGTYLKPDVDAKIRSVEANNNVYFTTSTGIQKLDSLTSTIVPAGAPKGLDGFAILATGGSGFMADNVQVAYRIVWGYQDANKNLIIGAPSQRIEIANDTGMTKDVILNITIPAEVTTNYFFQIYRSGFSATANDPANDEMALVYEANPTSTDITNKFVVVTDETPESLRNGAALYTSPSQEGILQSNIPPPFAKDVCLFKGSVFYANTKTKQNLTLSILSVSGQFSFSANTTNIAGDTPTTVRNLTSTITGTLTAGSNIITAVSDVSSLTIGQDISDVTNPTFLPAGTTIIEIIDSSTIMISNPATTGSVGDTFAIDIVGLFIGQIITGTGIPANTTITQIYTGFTSAGDVSLGFPNIINIVSTSGFKVGQIITDSGGFIPVDTVVSAITGPTTITISKNATGTLVGDTLTLHDGFQISNAATATGTTTVTVKNGTHGIQLNDTITVAGTTYTAKLVENIASKQFKIYSQGSPAQNIGDTAQSLVRVVNRTTGPIPTVYAFYLSGFQELPGKMQFEERIFGGGIFYATAGTTSQGTAYSPNLPGPGGISVSSENDQFGNGLYFSKTQQPEAVPLLNFTKVGSAHAAILRIIPLRDSLFILKEDGVFRLTGQDPTSFVVDLFDSTTQILSAESAVSLNNLIFMLSKYGIVTVSDTGVTVISRAIEDKMLDLFETDLTKVKNLSFGISYESDRKYIFFCITKGSDTTSTQAYVYNTFTTTWTRWVLSQGCGLITPSEDLMYLGDVTSNTFDVERKTRTFTDYTDSSFNVILEGLTGITAIGSSTITSISDTSFLTVGQTISGIGIPDNTQIISIPSGTSIILNQNATSAGTTTLLLDEGKTLIINTLANVEVGDVLWESNGRYSIITVVNTVNGTITVRDFINDWVLGSSTILKAFESLVQYAPQTAEGPGSIKQFRESVLLLQVPFFNEILVGFSTDLSAGTVNVPLAGLYGEQWGRFKWGLLPWGGTTKPIPLRTYVPQQKQRCSLIDITLTHREAYSFYRLNGISFVHNGLSERVGK